MVLDAYMKEYKIREQELKALSMDKQALEWGFTEEAKKVNDTQVIQDVVSRYLLDEF